MGSAARGDASAAPSADDAESTEEKESTLDRVIREGVPRLHRSTPDLLATGAVAGIEVGFGVLALLTVEHVTGSRLLAALAFSVGLIALRLGHSELFTEGFHIPVMVVAAKEATGVQLVRLWSGTLLGNLVGGWALAWLVAVGLPDLHGVAGDAAREFTAALDARTFVLAVLAGGAITLLTRMQQGTEDDMAKIVAAVAIAFVIVGTGLLHSVLDTLIIFVAIHAGEAGISYGVWLPWFGLVVAGNLAGGLVLTTLLRVVRSRERLMAWRAPDHGPSAHRD
ncbi:formate/nitrite transporter family protein [Cellulomonas sp. ATA003]|uniref:formate/nitrite transporter family protein n=1 Tax=Cellulomonas sp. ATA003 TaxID=3073064 RepID=UPI0028730E67|nr:formate/nitrite transporter family protein [Cellulomonas sp. ATA003]WNB86648.1 formate/nitrite transporter family protein [Cellulomonas sp. ATA003]